MKTTVALSCLLLVTTGGSLCNSRRCVGSHALGQSPPQAPRGPHPPVQEHSLGYRLGSQEHQVRRLVLPVGLLDLPGRPQLPQSPQPAVYAVQARFRGLEAVLVAAECDCANATST